MDALYELEGRVNNSFFYTLSLNKEFESVVKHAIKNKANSYDLFLLSIKQSINTFGASPLAVNKYRELSFKYKVMKHDYYYSKSPEPVKFLEECIQKSTLFKSIL